MPAELHADVPFELPEDVPSIPHKLGRDVPRFLTGLHRVTVEYAGDGGWKKINGFKVPDPEGVDPDDIAALIVQCAVHAYESTGNSGAYRGKFARRDKHGKSDPKFSSFSVPLEDNMRSAGSGGYVDEPVQALQYLASILDQQRTMNAQLIDYNQNLTEKLIAVAASASGKTEPLIQVISTLVAVYEAGLRMQTDALKTTTELQYNTEVAKLEAKKDEQMWKTLGPAIKIASRQAADHFGMPDPFEDEDDDEEHDDEEDEDDDEWKDEDDDDEPSGDADPKGAAADDKSDEDEPVKKKKPKKTTKRKTKKSRDPNKNLPPVVRMTKGWLETLKHDQWFAIEEAMSPKQWKLVRAATRTKDEDECADLMMKVRGTLFEDIQGAASVRKILRGDQWDALQAVMVLVEKHVKERKTKSTTKPGAKRKTKADQGDGEPSSEASDDA